MDIQYYKNFVLIVNEGSISAASKKLFISQSTISKQIKQLEDFYGTPLFKREKAGVKLTNSGRTVYKKAKQIIALYEESILEVNDLKNGMKEILNIAIPPTVYLDLISKNFHNYTELYPLIKLNIYEASSQIALDYLNNGFCELAITNAGNTNLDNYQYIELAKEEFKVFLPKDNKLCMKEEITLKDLNKHNICIPRAYVKDFSEIASKQGVNLNIDTTTTTSSGAIQMAQYKDIIAIVPLPNDENIIDALIVKPLKAEGLDKFTRKLLWKKNSELSKAAQFFIDCMNKR